MVKKILKNRIFLVIVTIILSVGTTVFATIAYNANQISYSPSDTSWNVSSVDAALNQLYDKKKTQSAYDFTNPRIYIPSMARQANWGQGQSPIAARGSIYFYTYLNIIETDTTLYCSGASSLTAVQRSTGTAITLTGNNGYFNLTDISQIVFTIGGGVYDGSWSGIGTISEIRVY